jgi:N6-adenosine-specific RNA methylase IME4
MILTKTSQLWELIESGRKFGTVYCDPPWQYEKSAKKGAAAQHYDCMSIDEIAEIPVSSLSLPKSHLHLWTTTSFLPKALWLMEHWGFEYRSQAIWCKPTLGTGNYYRVSHEILLLGAKGRLVFDNHKIKSWQIVGRGRHSQKPEIFRQFIESTSPEPRIELFARQSYPGWTVFGDQVEIGGLFADIYSNDQR